MNTANIEKINIEKFKAELREAYAILSALAPFVSSLLHRLRIVMSEDVETATVNSRNELFISSRFWSSLTIEEKTWLLAHEVLHVAMRDLHRMGDRDPRLWNIATDVVNNELLRQLGLPIEKVKRLYEMVATFEKLGIEIEDKNVTKERLYEILKEQYRYVKLTVIQDLTGDSGNQDQQQSSDSRHGSKDQTGNGSSCVAGSEETQHGDPSRVALQEGDPSLYDDSASAEEIERRIREAIRDAWMTAKLAGRMPGSLDRAIEELLKPKVDWRRLLRHSLEWGLPRAVIATWKRPSRRLDALPGIRHISAPTLYVLVDTSGSIGERELTQFASEIYAVAKHAGGKVVVVAWDAEVQGEFVLKWPSDIFRAKLKGGGGTVIAPALEYVLPHITRRDAVVILTDGHISDIMAPRVRKMLEELGRKVAIAVFVTTDAVPQLPKWRVIKIDAEGA